MIKRLLLIVSILFSVVTSAQEGTSSPYSFYGVGLTTFKGTIENQSMGGLSMYADSIHVNLRNPAAYGKLALTTYTLAASHQIAMPTNGEETGRTRATTIDYLAIGIPVGEKFGFGFGLLPYSSVGYDLYSIDRELEQQGRYSGSGGLNRVFLAGGYQITDNISIGAEANYNFGSLENSNVMVQSGIQYGSREVNESRLEGFGYNFSLNYERMLSNNLELRAMARYTAESDLTARNQRELAVVALTTDGAQIPFDIREFAVEDSELTLPSEVAFGLGVGQPMKWFVGGEYSRADATFFSNRSFMPQNATYTNATSYRLGGFYIPNYRALTGYFNRVVYRAGVRLEDTGLNLNGEDIQEFGITFGVGLPAGRMLTNINLGFEYGQRGTTSAGLIQEDFFKLSVSLSLSDRWFIKRRFD